MPTAQGTGTAADSPTRLHLAHKALFAFGLAAPLFTFLLAISKLSLTGKTAVLIGVSAVYAVICVWSYTNVRRERRLSDDDTEATAESKLEALDDANRFFGSSLKPADMFRLVSNRVRDIIPFEASAMFLPGEDPSSLAVEFADGDGIEPLLGIKGDTGSGIAGMAFLSGEVEFDTDLSIERTSRGTEPMKAFRSSAAIPLVHAGSVFAVFQIFSSRTIEKNSETEDLLRAIGERIAPLFVGSKAFERSLSNALTDPLTSLPNERAFFMVLENQLAESQRFRDDRPVSVLTIDIKGFDSANRIYGHGVGDQMLCFAGETLRTHLRRMDFLARASSDEFTVILPTASERVTQEVVARIRQGFSVTPFQVSEHEAVKLWLNFGWATFWKDGETSQQLIQAARLRKQQLKSEDPGNVLWFEREYVN